MYKLMHNYSFTHVSIFTFIQNFKVPLLLNRKLYVNMGVDMGGLFLSDCTVYIPDMVNKEDLLTRRPTLLNLSGGTPFKMIGSMV